MIPARTLRLTLSLAFPLALAAGAGCSHDPDLLRAVPAAGTITYDGKPLESGTVQFIPERGRAAHGAITAGKFTLSTYDTNDGAVPGRHTVVVTAVKSVPSKKGEDQEVSLIPEKYSQPGSSGVSVEIPAAGNKEIKIDLLKGKIGEFGGLGQPSKGVTPPSR